MVSNTLQQGRDTHAPIHGKAICCRDALNLCKVKTDSIAEVDTLGCPSPWFNGGALIPPHFKNCRTLAVDTFIDIVGQNWFGIARLGTPLQQTAVQRGPLPRWPQLSRVAWVHENVSVFQVIKRRCTATLVSVQYNGGLLPDVILLTQCYYHQKTRLNVIKRFGLCSL